MTMGCPPAVMLWSRTFESDRDDRPNHGNVDIRRNAHYLVGLRSLKNSSRQSKSEYSLLQRSLGLRRGGLSERFYSKLYCEFRIRL